nr:MAG TPA: hypothetical protein [Caudoviricetes sp.]
MNDILNLFFALVIISAISSRLFNELILFFIMCVYSFLLCSISTLRKKGVQKAPFIVFHVKH